jgi:hypothetical protein
VCADWECIHGACHVECTGLPVALNLWNWVCVCACASVCMDVDVDASVDVSPGVLSARMGMATSRTSKSKTSFLVWLKKRREKYAGTRAASDSRRHSRSL